MLHKYKLNNLNIVLDVNSGNVFSTDELTYDILDNISPPLSENCPEKVYDMLLPLYQKDDITACYGEIFSLYSQNALFSSDDVESLFGGKGVISPVKAMCLNVAHDCNMRCEYCFAGSVLPAKKAEDSESNERNSERKMPSEGIRLMPLNTAKKAIDFLLEKSADRQLLEVDFFGGEPLLNWDTVKETVRYARKKERRKGKHIRFTITTNCALLDDEKIDFINAEMENVVLSIDGRKEVHDKVRKFAGGGLTYDTVIANAKKLIEKRNDKEYYVRGTFTKYNLDFSRDVFALANEGFRHISVEPVLGKPEDAYAITETELSAVFKEYEKLANDLIKAKEDGHIVNFFHFLLDLSGGLCAYKRVKGCGCGNEYVAVTPEGDIYPCHQFVGDKEFLMGNVNTFGNSKQTVSIFAEMKEKFANSHLYAKTSCKSCWAKFYCSGGCDADNYHKTGNILTPARINCEIQKKRLECAIMLQAYEMNNEQWTIDSL